ncbi:hypothetical protein CPJCM30710_11730 [Clostridium polyendosporum]|uniref:Uncharacterized protein n=1 Tax=Clostridium polyendosporum TaxID=69208 RepID=A0A919RYA6_9CLOT|nr:hypothetical protein CPJCM30710_11730 [Clostridium polyendosporum]
MSYLVNNFYNSYDDEKNHDYAVKWYNHFLPYIYRKVGNYILFKFLESLKKTN